MNTPIKPHESRKPHQGFTIVELMVTIIVIAILATVGFIGWGSWRQNTAKREVQSDVQLAATAMRASKNANASGYPSALPSTFKSSANVTVEHKSSSATKFCIEAYSKDDTTIRYRFDSEQDSAPVAQTCSGSAGSSTPAPTGATLETTRSSKKIGSQNYTVLTASVKNGTCSTGTISWKIMIQSTPTVDWNSATWSSVTTKSENIPANGANIERYIFAKARCTVGGSSTEGSVLTSESTDS